MPSPEQNTATVNRYLELLAKANAEDIAALYADDATVEDPVGSDVHIGRQAIAGFYSNVPGAGNETEVMALRALGSEVAFFWRLTVNLGEGGKMAHRHHRGDDVRRRRQDRVDEGLLGPGQHQAALAASRSDLKDREPHRDVVADRRDSGAGVEELVVAERRRPRVGPLERVEHAADAVQRAADDQQHQVPRRRRRA